MAEFLSAEWFDDVNRAAPAGEELRTAMAGARVVLQQVVTGGPDGDVRYWVRIGEGTVAAGPGEAADADVTVSQSYDTAVAVSSGQLSAQAAVLAGRIRVSGDTTLLLAHQAALQELAGAFAPVRRRVTHR
jgi:putative sterol carrier protein